MVVLDVRPTAESPISGVVCAMMKTIAAATVSASGAVERVAGARREHVAAAGQRALPPGGSAGMRCSRSHSGQATVSTIYTRPPGHTRGAPGVSGAARQIVAQ